MLVMAARRKNSSVLKLLTREGAISIDWMFFEHATRSPKTEIEIQVTPIISSPDNVRVLLSSSSMGYIERSRPPFQTTTICL